MDPTKRNLVAVCNKAIVFMALLGAMSLNANSSSADTMVYDNTLNNTFSTGQNGTNELADDLHLTAAGDMTGFQFGVVSNGSTTATVRFYTNNLANSIWPGSGSSLLHTEVVSIAPSAFGLETVNLLTPVVVPQDLWMSIQYNSTSGQVRFFDPPTIGFSDDVVAFGGGAPANIFGAGRNNFQASISIADAVPEPTSMLVILFGSIAAAFSRRRMS